MKVKELRLGNWVRFSVGGLKNQEYRPHRINLSDFKHFTKEYIPIYFPIPLTEEILIKCGAKKINHIGGYSFYSFGESKINKCHIYIYDYKTEYFSYSVKKCEYLHELQNLFFVVTGKELEVEL